MRLTTNGILGLLAAAERHNGEITRQEATRCLGISDDALDDAVAEIGVLGVPPFGADDLISIEADGEWLYIDLPAGLSSVVVPTAHDVGLIRGALDALVLDAGDRSAANDLTERLTAVAGELGHGAVAWAADETDPVLVSALAEAIRAGREAVVTYYDKSSDRKYPFPVRPLALAQHLGRWYLSCTYRDQYRWLRLDRMLAVTEGAPVSTDLPPPPVARDVLFDGTSRAVSLQIEVDGGVDLRKWLPDAVGDRGLWTVSAATLVEAARRLVTLPVPYRLVGPDKAFELLKRWIGQPSVTKRRSGKITADK